MTDVEAVVPPSSAIDCIARLGGSARSQCLVKLGPLAEGAGFETSIPLTKYVGLFAERCGQKRSTGVASNRRTILAGPKVRIRFSPAVSRQTIGSSVAEPHLPFVMSQNAPLFQVWWARRSILR